MVRPSRVSLVAVLLLPACSEPAPPAAPPPPEVNFVTVAATAIPNVIEVPGRLQAVRTAEVRARVDGIVEQRAYVEGTDVAAGHLLFVIDPLPLQAQLNAAKATLERAKATAANVAQDVARYEGLVARRAISQQEYDATVARSRTAAADVAQAEAQVEAAALRLSYARVNAPIAGRAGRAEVTEGALVNAASGTLLTRIDQLDPIYVNFSQSSSDLLAMRRDISGGAVTLPKTSRLTVHLVLEDGTEYPQEGHLNFRDQSIDPATGTAALRAEFPNPNRSLLPGQFVRVLLDAGTRGDGIQVPQRAVTVAANGASVFVIEAGDTVKVRPIKLGPLDGDQWVVTEGLAAGARVVTDGLQKIRPGIVVKAVP